MEIYIRESLTIRIMRNAFTFILFFAIQIFIQAQFPTLHNTEQRICDYDLNGSNPILQFRDFDIFQTLDGSLNSPIDSSQCLELELDGNQEFIGQGLSNIIASFFSSYAGSGSFTRSGVNHQAGAKTPMSAIFAAVFLAVVLLLFAKCL